MLSVKAGSVSIDFRDVGSLMAGATGGPAAGLAVGCLSGSHLLALGGPTALACTANTILSGLVGGFVRRWRAAETEAISIPLALVSLAAGVSRVSLTVLLSGTSDALRTFAGVLPMVGVTLVGTLATMSVLSRIGRMHALQSNKAHYVALIEDSLDRTLDLLATVVDARDEYTARHSTQVARYAVAIGSRIGLEERQIAELWVGGLVHDVGKIAVPDAILSKPGILDESERQVIKSHAKEGARILRIHGGLLADMARFAELHHERYAGGGYPYGHPQADVLIGILTVADSIEAMASHRPYRASLPLPEVVEELKAASGGKLHPIAVAAALALIENDGSPHHWRVERPDLRCLVSTAADRLEGQVLNA